MLPRYPDGVSFHSTKEVSKVKPQHSARLFRYAFPFH